MKTSPSRPDRDGSSVSSIGATSFIRRGGGAVKVPLGPSGNRLLAALPREEYRKLLPHLHLVSLPLGKVLSEPGEPIRYACFPTTAVVSLVTPIQGYGSEEVAVVGNEGMISVSLMLEGDAARVPPRHPVVARAGYTYRVPADVLVTEFRNCIAMQQLLLHYTQALMTQIAQTGICNRHHRVEQQLSRWLLHRLDRSPGYELPTTQQRIANLLGVRRESVTQAVQALQRAGIIRCKRGGITVLSRSQLERQACECYALVAKEYARLLPLRASASCPLVISSHGASNAELGSKCALCSTTQGCI